MRAILRFRRTVYATKIQRWHRERQALKWQARFRKRKAKQFAASTRINAVARGFLARRRAQALAQARDRRRAVLAERAAKAKALEEERRQKEARSLAGRVKAAKEAAAKAKAKAAKVQQTTLNVRVGCAVVVVASRVGVGIMMCSVVHVVERSQVHCTALRCTGLLVVCWGRVHLLT